MRTLAALLLFTISANGQTLNNATVNITGSYQNVTITQSGANHSATLNLSGDNISAIVSQSGNIAQSFSLSVTCGSNCPNSPYIVNQY